MRACMPACLHALQSVMTSGACTDDCACGNCFSYEKNVMLVCDGCEKMWHQFCVHAAGVQVPEGQWYGPCCLPHQAASDIVASTRPVLSSPTFGNTRCGICRSARSVTYNPWIECETCRSRWHLGCKSPEGLSTWLGGEHIFVRKPFMCFQMPTCCHCDLELTMYDRSNNPPVPSPPKDTDAMQSDMEEGA